MRFFLVIMCRNVMCVAQDTSSSSSGAQRRQKVGHTWTLRLALLLLLSFLPSAAVVTSLFTKLVLVLGEADAGTSGTRLHLRQATHGLRVRSCRYMCHPL